METTVVNESKPGCVAGALAILGNKWTGLVLKDLSSGPKRFCDLESSLTGISPRTLSQRLDDLEGHGVVAKNPYSTNPPRHEYELTKKGADLLPVLQQMAEWGKKYYRG